MQQHRGHGQGAAQKPVPRCRAERLRRVIAGYGGKDGYTLAQGGEFAYLQLDKLNAADVVLDATPAHAAALLALRNTATAPQPEQ